VDAYHDARPEAAQREQQRQTIEGQLRRLGDLFVMGDLHKADYEARRAELVRLTEADAHGRPEVLERLQRYVLNAGAAWRDADAGQRNRLGKALVQGVMVRDGHLVSVLPRPEFEPYFVLAEMKQPTRQESGSAVSPENRKERARGDSNPRSPA
jgi:hypothetical protein